MTQGLCGKVSLRAVTILVAGLCAASVGAIPGVHIVVITPFFDESPEMEDVLSGDVTESEIRIPRHYQDASTSPLRANVETDEPNNFLFELAP